MSTIPAEVWAGRPTYMKQYETEKDWLYRQLGIGDYSGCPIGPAGPMGMPGEGASPEDRQKVIDHNLQQKAALAWYYAAAEGL